MSFGGCAAKVLNEGATRGRAFGTSAARKPLGWLVSTRASLHTYGSLLCNDFRLKR